MVVRPASQGYSYNYRPSRARPKVASPKVAFRMPGLVLTCPHQVLPSPHPSSVWSIQVTHKHSVHVRGVSMLFLALQSLFV